MRLQAPPAGPVLGEPRWLISIALAAAATAVACYPAWPGYMSYDSLFAYHEAVQGIETMLWPPLHAYLFALSRALGGATGGVFLLQTFGLFLGANLTVNLLCRDRRLAALLCLAFALSFVFVPPQLGVLQAHWRDVLTATFTVLGLAAWLLAGRYRRTALAVAAAALFGLAVALRYNAIVLLVFLLALLVWRPLGAHPAGPRRRAVLLVATLAFLLLAWGSTQWRLPDLRRLPSPDSLGGTQEFDLIGISACADHNYLPLELSSGQPITPYQIRKIYDERHLQLNLTRHPGIPQLLESDASGQVAPAWRAALRREPGCYLRHRLAVFVEQMGLAKGHVFYPVHGQIDPNPYGLKLAHPEAAARVNAYIERHAPQRWRRPVVLYAAALLAGLAAAWRRREVAALFLAMLGGAFAYPALLFVAAPAADARYIFPSSVICALVVAMAIAVVAQGDETRKPA